MINSLTQRQRRPFGNSQKSRDNFPLNLGLNGLSIYAKQQPYYNAKPLTHRPKGKQNTKNRRSIKKDEFPDFAIKFRNQTFESNKISESFTSRNQAENKLSQSFGMTFFNEQNKYETNKYGSMKKQNKNNQLIRNQHWHKKVQQNHPYFTLFVEALSKIFKSLDVFNRGRISQTNINKWIPESALYFLGGIFQKIKQERLALNYPQFQTLCIPLLNQSAQQDIKWFIQEVNGKQTQLNISIEVPSSQKGKQNSPVILKFNNFANNHYIEKPRQSSNRKQNEQRHQSPIQFEKVLKNIKNKEKQLNLRLNSMKQKPKILRIDPKSQPKQFSFFNTQDIPTTNQFNNDFSEFKQIKIEKSQKTQQKNNLNNHHLIKSSQKQVPNFTFQLPKSPVQFEDLKLEAKNLQRRSNPSDYQHTSSVPKTSRIVRQSVPKEIANSYSKRCSVQEDKIDKLSSRLEEYIKFNKQKLQQNKNFIKENSLPRK